MLPRNVLGSNVYICDKSSFFFFEQKTAYEVLSSLVGSEMCISVSSSTWYQVLGTKYLVPSTWYKVLGTKYVSLINI